jgi:malonyl-CoA O-methyltransferase
MALCNNDVRRRFDLAADDFDNFDFVHTVTRDGLMARLEPMLVRAKTVVDLGCATGTAYKPLAKKFRGAHIIALDQSTRMLQVAGEKRSWFSKYSLLRAQANAIPLADQSVDVVFCNQLLPWIEDGRSVFSEVGRILRKNGLFLFASLGPDSFSELQQAWTTVDTAAHVHRFPDMHDLGDAAVHAGMHDPVLDVDRLKISYKSVDGLFRDLTGIGGRNCRADRPQALTGKNRFKQMTAALEGQGQKGLIELDLELVYGHCWGSGPRARDGEVRISVEGIGRRS